MNEDLVRNIDRLLAQRRKTDPEASDRKVSIEAGLGADFIRNIRRRPDASPRHTNLKKLADFLGTTVGDLTRPAGEVSVPEDQPPPAVTGEATPVAAFNLRQVQEAMPGNLPVMGTAGASFTVRHEGAFEMEARIVEYVRRPPALMNVPDAYAIYVSGSSMEPRYLQGELLFVHPHRPPRHGDPVLIQAKYREHEGIEAFVAFYQKTTAEYVITRKLNPVSEVKYLRSAVLRVHKILTPNELFGV